jgi:hypothetical protein
MASRASNPEAKSALENSNEYAGAISLADPLLKFGTGKSGSS